MMYLGNYISFLGVGEGFGVVWYNWNEIVCFDYLESRWFLMCRGFVGKQFDSLEKGIRVGVEEYCKQNDVEGLSAEAVSKVMAQRMKSRILKIFRFKAESMEKFVKKAIPSK